MDNERICELDRALWALVSWRGVEHSVPLTYGQAAALLASKRPDASLTIVTATVAGRIINKQRTTDNAAGS